MGIDIPVPLSLWVCIVFDIYMGVSENRGTPKWMVYNDPIKMDDLGKTHHLREHPYKTG